MEKLDQLRAGKNFPSHEISGKLLIIERAPLRSYWEDEQIRDVEEVSAALARVETVLRCLGYSCPGRLRENESQGLPTYPSDEKLLELMRREPSLLSYLEKNASKSTEDSSDPLAAWAAAAGDVAFLGTLHERGWQPAGKSYFGLAKTVVLPVTLIVVTALCGNWIATALQQEAFKHQRTFDVRLDGLRKGQDRAADLYTSINEAYSTIEDAEDHRFTGILTAKLRAERQKLDSISAASRLYDNNRTVRNAMDSAATLLDQYIGCLDRKRLQEQQRSPDEAVQVNCSRQSDGLLLAFDKIVDAHSVAISDLTSSEP